MEEKFSTRIYPAIIVATFLMSLAALCRTYERKLDIDYIGIIIGILALLVTALIGWQVLQAILIEDKIKQIAKETSSKVAHDIAEEVSMSVSKEIASKAAKDANTIAKKTAQKASKDTVTFITDDLKHIMDALSPLVNARVNTVFSRSLRAIGWYCASLDEYNRIQDSTLRQEYTSMLFEEFLRHAEKWKEDDHLCADQNHLGNYISLLDTFDTPQSIRLKELLLSSREETEEDRVFDHIESL